MTPAPTHRECVDKVASLSDREMFAALCITKGMSAKEIAKASQRSPDSVKDSIKAIFAKFGINSREQAAVIVAKAGIV